MELARASCFGIRDALVLVALRWMDNLQILLKNLVRERKPTLCIIIGSNA